MLELRGVGFGYGVEEWVFRNVSFAVLPGTATAILGPNGSGKTTLVRCAAGLLTPREGTVRLLETIGYVPQARSSSFAYSALDMVLMGRTRRLGLFSSPGPADRRAAIGSMERVGVADLSDRLFPTLSGGEQQLVLIARMLSAGSPALILDEPANGLDVKNQVRVLTLLRELLADGIAILLSTHDPDHALYLASSVVLMGAETVSTGTAHEMLIDAKLSALYGVTVKTIEYRDDSGAVRRSVVTGYGDPV